MKYIVAWSGLGDMKVKEVDNVELAERTAHTLASMYPRTRIYVARVEKFMIMDTVREIDNDAE